MFFTRRPKAKRFYLLLCSINVFCSSTTTLVTPIKSEKTLLFPACLHTHIDKVHGYFKEVAMCYTSPVTALVDLLTVQRDKDGQVFVDDQRQPPPNPGLLADLVQMSEKFPSFQVNFRVRFESMNRCSSICPVCPAHKKDCWSLNTFCKYKTSLH